MKTIRWIIHYHGNKEVRKLVESTSYQTVEDQNHGRECTLNQVDLALFSVDFFKEPTIYKETVNCEQSYYDLFTKKLIQEYFKRNTKKFSEDSGDHSTG
jgi:hypothetical protein